MMQAKSDRIIERDNVFVRSSDFLSSDDSMMGVIPSDSTNDGRPDWETPPSSPPSSLPELLHYPALGKATTTGLVTRMHTHNPINVGLSSSFDSDTTDVAVEKILAHQRHEALARAYAVDQPTAIPGPHPGCGPRLAMNLDYNHDLPELRPPKRGNSTGGKAALAQKQPFISVNADGDANMENQRFPACNNNHYGFPGPWNECCVGGTSQNHVDCGYADFADPFATSNQDPFGSAIRGKDSCVVSLKTAADYENYHKRPKTNFMYIGPIIIPDERHEDVDMGYDSNVDGHWDMMDEDDGVV